MKNTVKITATAPTGYQLQSLRAFGMGVQKNASGSFSACQEFCGKEEAETYLRNRARAYNDEDPCGNDQRLEDMFNDIEHGVLTLDAVTAYIEEIEETEEA